MLLNKRLLKALNGLAILMVLSGGTASAEPSGDDGLKAERVFILMRHGLRSPIVGEVPDGTLTAQPLPRWPVDPEQITPHGAKVLALQAQLDRQWLDAAGLLATDPCTRDGAVVVWTNTADRTIASGQAYGSALLPECPVAPQHQPKGTIDPLFEPLRAAVNPFDADAAITSITSYTGGVEALARRHDRSLRKLDRMLGCTRPTGCSPPVIDALRASDDGKGVELAGTIRSTSGTAQVLLLLYAEGLTGPGQAWPAIDPADLEDIGALHSALFDVFTRPPYMAARQGGPLAQRLLNSFGRRDPAAPVLEVLIGHDTNVTALGALLQLQLRAPGYADGDVPPGGAIIFELLSDRQSQRFVRLHYRTQSPEQLRNLIPAHTITRLDLPGCTTGPARTCPLESFRNMVEARLPQ